MSTKIVCDYCGKIIQDDNYFSPCIEIDIEYSCFDKLFRNISLTRYDIIYKPLFQETLEWFGRTNLVSRSVSGVGYTGKYYHVDLSEYNGDEFFLTQDECFNLIYCLSLSQKELFIQFIEELLN